MKFSKLVLAASLLFGISTQAMGEVVEYIDADKVKWSVNTTDGTAMLVNMIHIIGRGDVVLPDEITYEGKEYKVTGIGQKACINNGSLLSLTVGKYVEFIDSAAYTGSSKLAKVVLPQGVKTIGIRAFAGCSVLQDINIPSSVTSIGAYSFQATSMASFDVSAAVTHIGENPFRSCTTLKSISVAEENANYCSKDGVLFTKDMKQLICLPAGIGISSYAIPEGVVNIGDNSMRNNATLTSVTMPSTLESIGEMAFAVSAIKEVNISKNVRVIGKAAFYMMSALTDFNVDADNPYYKGENGLLLSKDGKQIYSSIVRTGDYSIPEGVERLGSYAFYGNSGLTSLNLSGVKHVGPQCFYNCTNLQTVNFGDNIEVIDTMSFQYCTALKTLSFPPSLRSIECQAFCYDAAITSINFNDDLAFIGNMAFYGNHSLSRVSIPGKVRFSDKGAAFYVCNALRTVELAEGIEELPTLSFSNCGMLTNVKVPSTLKIIGPSSFQLTSALTRFEFPAGLKAIENTAFNRSNLQGPLVIPDGVEELGSWAFTSNKGLTSFKGGKNLKRLMDHSLHGCSSLSSIYLPEGLEFIGINALSIINDLTILVIPSTVTQMDSMCINYNVNMKDLVLKPTVPPVTNGLLADYIGYKKDGVDWNPYEYTILHVPEGCYEVYRNHPHWGRFQNIIDDADGVGAVMNDDEEATIKEVYDLQGRRYAAPVPGQVNIIRYSNGKVSKVMIPRQ